MGVRIWGRQQSPAKCSPPSFVPLLETVAAGAADIYLLYLRRRDDCKVHQQRDQSHLTFHAYTVDTTPKVLGFRHLRLAFTLSSQAMGRNYHCKSLK